MRKVDVFDKAFLQSICKKEFIRNSESRFLHRLHCVLLVAQGRSCYQVAGWFGEHPSTVGRWIRCFHEYGPEGLRDEQKTGRPRKVRDDQIKRLQSDISINPSELGYDSHKWNGKLVKIHLEQYYGIELSVRQSQRLLSQLRLNTTSQGAPF
jgi:transposase